MTDPQARRRSPLSSWVIDVATRGPAPGWHPSAGKFQRVGKTRPQAHLASARLIRVSSPFTEPLLDLHHAVLQVRELADGHLVGQDRPPRPEPNRLGLGLFGERDDPIGRPLRS